MKHWFTIDDFIIAFIAAVAYGFGYSVPAACGLPGWLCFIICYAVGRPIEMVAEEIIFSEFTQAKRSRKLLVFAAFIIVFLICHFISMGLFGDSLFECLEEEFGYVILFAVGGFLISTVKLYYRTRKVRKRYGDGVEGFRFDKKEKAYVVGLNQKNAEITDEYDPALAVKTRTGVYVGEMVKDVISFEGIPYAQPPVGMLRWKAPEKLTDCDKVFEAKNFGPSAIQVNYEGNPLGVHQQSEDCLYLNVYTTDIAPEVKKPVVVYFHGGDFTYGGAANPLWEMWNFAKDHPDVVAVSFNYRLGLLGFIDFSAVPGGEAYPDAANLGLLDQIAALEWVKKNISAFGGDPEQITVMGDSAGGTSIGLLAICARAKGLFQKAIILSGNPYFAEIGNMEAKTLAHELMNATGVSSMDGLLALSEKALSELTQELKINMGMPQLDGKLIPNDVYAAYERGEANDVQMVLCTSKDNLNVYSSIIGRGFYEKTLSDFVEKTLSLQNPEVAEKLRSLLNDEVERVGKVKAESVFANLWIDQKNAVMLAKSLHAAGNAPQFLYWDVDAIIKDLGAGYVNIVAAILNNDETAMAYGVVVKDSVRDVLQTLIVKVILDEAPELYNNEVEGVNAIKWDRYPKVLKIGKKEIQLQSVEDALLDVQVLIHAIG